MGFDTFEIDKELVYFQDYDHTAAATRIDITLNSL